MFSKLLIVRLFAFSIKLMQVKLISKSLEKEEMITFTKDYVIYLNFWKIKKSKNQKKSRNIGILDYKLVLKKYFILTFLGILK